MGEDVLPALRRGVMLLFLLISFSDTYGLGLGRSRGLDPYLYRFPKVSCYTTVTLLLESAVP